MISSGDNMPAFYLPVYSLDYFLIALHKNIEPGHFKEYLGWSDSTFRNNIEILKQYDFLKEKEGRLEPNVMIFTQP